MGIETLVWLFVAIVGVYVIIKFAINKVREIEEGGINQVDFLGIGHYLRTRAGNG